MTNLGERFVVAVTGMEHVTVWPSLAVQCFVTMPSWDERPMDVEGSCSNAALANGSVCVISRTKSDTQTRQPVGISADHFHTPDSDRRRSTNEMDIERYSPRLTKAERYKGIQGR